LDVDEFETKGLGSILGIAQDLLGWFRVNLPLHAKR